MGLGQIFRCCWLTFFIPFAILCFFTNLPLAAKPPSKKIKTAVCPYLIPENHPIKTNLDQIFNTSRLLLNLKTLENAGFVKTQPQKHTRLLVTTHPDFPGYIFKLYLDAQYYHGGMPEYECFILRIQGAEKIRKEIEKNKLGDLFQVPHKWIYALPKYFNHPKGYQTKYFILVEEDMDILSYSENKALWASDQITFEQLEGLFKIIDSVGLKDCLKPDNIPMSRNGRISFIDTQTFDCSVNYKKLLSFLSKRNQAYWKILFRENK